MVNETKFNKYATNVARKFKIKKSDLFSTKRKQEFSDARHVLFWVSIKSGITISYIQKYCKHNGLTISHPAVIHGVSKIDSMEHDDDMADLINSIVTNQPS